MCNLPSVAIVYLDDLLYVLITLLIVKISVKVACIGYWVVMNKACYRLTKSDHRSQILATAAENSVSVRLANRRASHASFDDDRHERRHCVATGGYLVEAL